MISMIEARRFRCLKYIRQELGPFHVLVGPNASGKTTFLDVVSFLGDLVSEGLEAALEKRSRNFLDLVWKRGEPAEFELAISAKIPIELRSRIPDSEYDQIRYEVKIGNSDADEIMIRGEKALLSRSSPPKNTSRTLFPMTINEPSTTRGRIQVSRHDLDEGVAERGCSAICPQQRDDAQSEPSWPIEDF